MLRPEGIASPAPTKAFTFELSPPKSPPRDVEYHYAGKSANSRDRTFTGKTKQHYGLQAKTQRTQQIPESWLIPPVARTDDFGIQPNLS